MLAKIEHALQSNCTVIFMDCDSRDSAYKLFQVLNDRGAGLNEGDLLKSKTLEVLEHFPEEQEQVQKRRFSDVVRIWVEGFIEKNSCSAIFNIPPCLQLPSWARFDHYDFPACTQS